uniref:Uncharacterized protein MANES_04G089500 n=1 Tax=Rhizophora mucronata TaxID=61149 RepID=A0A2P2LYS3_RHIMU
MHPFFSHRSKNQSGAALVAHQKKADTAATLLVHDPSIDTDRLRDFIVRPFGKTPKHPEVELFPSQTSPPDTGNFKSAHHRSYGPKGMPSSVHDVETMRICTTIDSAEKYLKVPQKFSQATHQVFFTRQTDVSLFDGGQVFRESILTASEGKNVNEFPCLSPDFTVHIKQGLKLQPLGSFIENARKEDADQVKTTAYDLKNELTVETDTMDMDALQRSHLLGLASSQSNKHFTSAGIS